MGRIADKDSVSEREKLQKDLQHTKSALEDIKREETSPVTNQSSNASSPGDEQVRWSNLLIVNGDGLAIFLIVAFSRNVFQEPG